MKHLMVAAMMAAMAMVAVQAQATPISTSCAPTTCGIVGQVTTAGAFSDTFDLSPLGAGPFSAASGIVSTIDLSPVEVGHNIDFTSVFLTSSSGNHAFTLSGPAGAEVGTLFLAGPITGPLTLTVAGISDATASSAGTYTGSVNVAASVPEPLSLLLLGSGLAGLGIVRRKFARG